MAGIKVRVRCRDCGSERVIEPMSVIIPIVGDCSCLCDGAESTAMRCPCGCEAFRVLRLE